MGGEPNPEYNAPTGRGVPGPIDEGVEGPGDEGVAPPDHSSFTQWRGEFMGYPLITHKRDSVNSSMAYFTPSRPKPERLMPP